MIDLYMLWYIVFVNKKIQAMIFNVNSRIEGQRYQDGNRATK